MKQTQTKLQFLTELKLKQIEFLQCIDCKDSTKKTYLEGFHRFNKWIEMNDIQSISQGTLLQFKQELLEEYKPNTVNIYLMAVKQLFSFLEAHYGEENVAKDLKKVKTSSTFEKGVLTPVQCAILLNSIQREDLKGKRDFAMLTLMLTSGLRCCEVMSANNDDIYDGRLYIKGKGEFEKNEFVTLCAPALTALEEYVDAKGETLDQSKPLFQSIGNRNRGERLTTWSVNHIVKQHLQEIGIDSDNFSAHSTRHTAVTLALIGGEKLEDVQRMARHKSMNTTLTYYHYLENKQNTCSNTIANMIF